MSLVSDSSLMNGNQNLDVNHLLHFADRMDRLVSPFRSHEHCDGKGIGGFPVDIVEKPTEYVFLIDLPGLSKADIQVTVEDDKILVIRSNGKRKREKVKEGCKYLRLERRVSQNLMKKFRLPEDSNVSTISAKCEDGVLSITLKKLPPTSKARTVSISIS